MLFTSLNVEENRSGDIIQRTTQNDDMFKIAKRMVKTNQGKINVQRI